MITLVAVSEPTKVKAESCLVACERCAPEAEIPFDWLLDEITGCNGADVDYIVAGPATCPRCLGRVTEKTLVEWRWPAV